MWITSVWFDDGIKKIQRSEIEINRDIVQGDTFSALWFCLTLNHAF